MAGKSEPEDRHRLSLLRLMEEAALIRDQFDWVTDEALIDSLTFQLKANEQAQAYHWSRVTGRTMRRA